jgi:hypothetical protein
LILALYTSSSSSSEPLTVRVLLFTKSIPVGFSNRYVIVPIPTFAIFQVVIDFIGADTSKAPVVFQALGVVSIDAVVPVKSM